MENYKSPVLIVVFFCHTDFCALFRCFFVLVLCEKITLGKNLIQISNYIDSYKSAVPAEPTLFYIFIMPDYDDSFLSDCDRWQRRGRRSYNPHKKNRVSFLSFATKDPQKIVHHRSICAENNTARCKCANVCIFSDDLIY